MTDSADESLTGKILDRLPKQGASPRISVVAPCFNEQDNLDELLRRVSEACRGVAGDSFEIILVNDGSNDGTWDAIQKAAHDQPNIVGINLSRNHGHQRALSAGLSLTRGERILIIDADLQDPPELLPDMVALMDDGAEVVYGQRTERLGDSGQRKAASAIFYRLLRWLSDIDIPLDTGDFRLISRRVLDVLSSMPEDNRFIRGMVSWVGFRQVPLEYQRDQRLRGKTSYSLRKLMGLALDGLTGFSVRPLRLATYAGIIVATSTFLYTIFVLVQWFFWDISLEGWPTIVISISFLGGMQLLFLGLLGEYLGRVFQEVKKRPHFIIADVITSDNPDIKNN